MVDASVVIPARNVAELLPEQLRALAKQRVERTWEVIVADNGSTDDTAAVARSFVRDFPVPLRVVDASRAAGATVARNEGVKAAHGQVLLFCDGDDIVGTDWITSMLVALEKHEIVGGCLEFDLLNEPGSVAWRVKPSDSLQVFRGVRFPTAANFGLRREVFDSVGPFNESFQLGYEEVEYLTRGQDLGYEATFAPDAIVHYRLRGTRKALMRQRFKYGRGSALLLAAHPQLFLAGEDSFLPRLRAICRTGARIVKRSLGPADERDDLLVHLATDVGAALEYARGRMLTQLPSLARTKP